MSFIRKFLRVLFFLFILSPLVYALFALLNVENLRFIAGVHINLIWLANALMFLGMSWFGMPITRFIRIKGFIGKIISGFIAPALIGIFLLAFVLPTILHYPLFLLALHFYEHYGGEAGLLFFAGLTYAILIFLGVLRLALDRRVSERLKLNGAELNIVWLALILLLSLISALTTGAFLSYGDYLNTVLASMFRESPLIFLGSTVRSYVAFIPAIGVGMALFSLLWILEGSLKIILQAC